MITIEYRDDFSCNAIGDCFVDRWIANTVMEVLEDIDDDMLEVSNENVIYEIRARVAEGSLPHDAIRFKYRDEIIRIDRNGELDKHPEGFCDQQRNALRRLI